MRAILGCRRAVDRFLIKRPFGAGVKPPAPHRQSRTYRSLDPAAIGRDNLEVAARDDPPGVVSGRGLAGERSGNRQKRENKHLSYVPWN
jgi:hypothetical protein